MKNKKTSLPRPEYPRMQFRRESSWLNLNGTWDFRIDRTGSARERGIVEKKELFDKKIVVPFCPESKLSGVADVDFMQDVWYRREVTFPKAWAGRRIFLRFGGVDFLAEAWLDGKNAGSHNGGSAPFALDVTDLAKPGAKQVLVVHAHDETRGDRQGEGKQSGRFFSAGCHYTRVTGIWQTVWAEAVHPQGLAACRTTPNLDTSEVVLEPRFLSVAAGDRFRAVVRAGGEVVAERDVPAVQGAPVSLAIPDVRPWSPSDPFLYDLTLTVERGGKPVDAVESYFAMRKVSCEGNRVLLNGRPVFLRFVLDQGFYPDGVWPPASTARACTRRSSRTAGTTGPTASATSRGPNTRAGASTRRSPRRSATSSRSGRPSSPRCATTRRSSAGRRSTSRRPTASTSGTSSPRTRRRTRASRPTGASRRRSATSRRRSTRRAP